MRYGLKKYCLYGLVVYIIRRFQELQRSLRDEKKCYFIHFYSCRSRLETENT